MFKWKKYNGGIIPDEYPHIEPSLTDLDEIANNGSKYLFIRYTSDFDCESETGWWYTILDKPFDIQAVKAKRRYEINKGNKNFYTKIIKASDFGQELYDVYMESLEGYAAPTVLNRKQFDEQIKLWDDNDKLVLFGVFSREDDSLCGYADVYRNEKYLPISSMKTRVSCERDNVNFALVYGIVSFFEEELKQGAYLCDGARNIIHKTSFQDYLEKYFGFRKAYCRLHMIYSPKIRVAVRTLYCFRRVFKKLDNIGIIHKINGLLLMEEIARGSRE